MKRFHWNEEKNRQLGEERGVSFEMVVWAIANGQLLEIVEHPNRNKYPNQKIYVLAINNYIYLVPFVEENDQIFLRTVIPSRKATRQYLGRNKWMQN
jgi:uncharacterized DUF497 family protein